MTPSELKAHKDSPKSLSEIPSFKPMKRGKFPRPFQRIGGPRFHSTPLLDVGEQYRVFSFYRDGAIYTDVHFYAYLMLEIAPGQLTPLFEFHWHPSHKGFHCKVPCGTTSDYTGRTLPGAPELSLATLQLDPRDDAHRRQLVREFCKRIRVSLPNDLADKQADLWT